MPDIQPKNDPVYRREGGSQFEEMPDCKCMTWARVQPTFWIGHHPNCPKYSAREIAHNIIEPLLEAIEKWGAEEDGIHSDAWEPYVRACEAIGQWKRFENQEPV